MNVLKTLALIQGFLPVKFQCYRITHVRDYHSFHFTTILWKILCLILFGHIKTDFVRYLFGSASRINWDKLTVGEMVQDIESVGQRDWFIVTSFESTGLKLSGYTQFCRIKGCGGAGCPPPPPPPIIFEILKVYMKRNFRQQFYCPP